MSEAAPLESATVCSTAPLLRNVTLPPGDEPTTVAESVVDWLTTNAVALTLTLVELAPFCTVTTVPPDRLPALFASPL
ncbi:hypothetical protein ASC91_25750 [Pelomonas sp. Root1237]|nr:hypothetical protein ASC91_25750 [Pelomonas sp. Root1237]